jgi:hypothetical protein
MQVESPVDTSLRTTQGGVSINEGFFLAFVDQEMRVSTEQEQKDLTNSGINIEELQELRAKIGKAKEAIYYSENLEIITDEYQKDGDEKKLQAAKSILNKQLLDAVNIPVETILKYASISMKCSEQYFGANAAH